jgi:hypothetical protein
MYKRPPLRVRELPRNIREPVNIKEGTFLHKILKKEPTTWAGTGERQPVYQKEVYLALLKRNCREMGIEYKEPNIPDYILPNVTNAVKEMHPSYIDHVHLRLRILKSGIVRVKLDTSLIQLYEKYYRKCVKPPIKSVIQAYKSMGYSPEFLEKIKNKSAKLAEFSKKASGIIDSIFNKEPTKKPKKAKKKEEEEPIEDEEEPEEERDDDEEEDEEVGDDEGMDVEVEEDPDEQPQDVDEEAYISD